MQTRPEVSWANCGMCAVERRDTSSGPAIPEWNCERKRRVLTLPRALHPEARPCGQVLREIVLAVSVNTLKTRPGRPHCGLRQIPTLQKFLAESVAAT